MVHQVQYRSYSSEGSRPSEEGAHVIKVVPPPPPAHASFPYVPRKHTVKLPYNVPGTCSSLPVCLFRRNFCLIAWVTSDSLNSDVTLLADNDISTKYQWYIYSLHDVSFLVLDLMERSRSSQVQVSLWYSIVGTCRKIALISILLDSVVDPDPNWILIQDLWESRSGSVFRIRIQILCFWIHSTAFRQG